MRSVMIVVWLGLLSTPLLCWAQQPLGSVVGHGHVGATCPCGHVHAAPAPVISAPIIQPSYNACNSCGGGCGSGSGLCANHAEFYHRLYAEFWANNQWYAIHKQQEAAARRARMYGRDYPEGPVQPMEPMPAKPAPKQPAPKPPAPQPAIEAVPAR